jgi:membrane-associated protease RseP (regulator of RpoE activity)
MTEVTYALGVLLFVVGVAVSVGLHELGHLIPGKLFDVKVTQYFVGFGRTLWSRRRGETEYGVKAVPLGGYVKLVGMLPPGPETVIGQRSGDAPRAVRSSHTGVFSQLMSDARAAEYDLVDPGDEDRLFYRLAWWKKIVVMASGVMTNLVLAFVLFAVVYMGHGVPTATTTVSQVSRCVVATTVGQDTPPCTAADPQAPASRAGIRPGDRIVSFNGTAVSGWPQLQRLIRGNDAGPAVIGVERDGARLTLRTNTTVSTTTESDRVTRRGFLGVTPTATAVRQGPGYVVSTMASGTWQTLQALGHLPVKVYHVGRAALGLEKRSVDSPMSVVGAGRVAGQLTSADSVPVADRFFQVLLLLAGLNLFLAMFNLVPLPPLDGGPIATTLFEAARRGIARLRHKPDPGFVDSAKLLPVTYVMAMVILVVSVVLIYADIVAPVSIS